MSSDAKDLSTLCDLVARLRAPAGCPWDREQTLETMRPHLLEEAHEAAGAMQSGDWERIQEELGDLLFQIAFVLELGREAGVTGPADAVAAIEAKMIARHPHVFGGEPLASAADVEAAWEAGKLAASDEPAGLLDGIPESLPALLAAQRLTRRAATVGFDWPSPSEVIVKVREELAELEAEIELAGEEPGDASRDRVSDELGDLLFACANLARHLGHEPEAALARANRKFRRRFRAVEEHLAVAGRRLTDATLEEMEAAWQIAKAAEQARPSSSAETEAT